MKKKNCEIEELRVQDSNAQKYKERESKRDRVTERQLV